MKTPVPFSFTMVGLSLLLVVASALAVRSSAPRMVELSSTSSIATVTATTTVPDFASAAFVDGDALKGLGADWTFLDQSMESTSTVTGLPGLYQTRVSRVKVNGKDITLMIAEANIIDQKKLAEALKPMKKTTIAGRNGYVLSNGFFLAGSSTSIFLQDELEKTWPSQPNAETLSYIATANVR